MTMTALTDLLDSCVKKLKKTQKFEGVKFVFSGKVRAAEFPLLSFVVATSAAGISMENPCCENSAWRATLHFDIYGHKDASKRDVSSLCLRISQELTKVLSAENAEMLESSEAVYDSNLCVWRQQIRLKLSIKEQSFKVYLGGKLLELTDFEEAEEYSLYPVKEVFCGVTSYADTGNHKRHLLVGVKGEDNPFTEDVFDLFEGVKGVLYKDCRVTQMTSEHKSGQQKICRYTLIFREKIYDAEGD